MPLWNPHNYGGIPLLGVLQPGILYPPQVAYLFLPFPIVWNWMIILHFALAGFTTYLFLRYVKVSTEGSLLGGLIFMLSGYLLSLHNLLSYLLAVPWFPLVIVCYLKYFDTKRITCLIFAALFLVMEFLAGAPEIVIMTILVLSVVTISLKAFLPDRDISSLTRIKALVVLSLLFLILSAVQLVPFYELKTQSIRQGGLSYSEATIWSLGWRDFIQFFVPDPFGNLSSDRKYWQNQSWLKTIYLGIGPFFLSAFYFLKRDRKQPVFVILILLSLLLALGGNTPLYKYIYRCPPLDSMRYPVKYLMIFFFVISALSGLGFDSLRSGVAGNSGRVVKTIGVMFYAGFAFALFWGYMSLFGTDVHGFFDRMGFKPEAYNEIRINIHNLQRFFLFSFLFCVGLMLYLRSRLKGLIIAGLVVLVSLDLFLANCRHYEFKNWGDYIRKHEFVDLMTRRDDGSRYLLTPKAANEFKVFPADRLAMAPAYAALFGVSAFDGAEVFRIARHESLLNLITSAPSLADAKRLFGILGIRYLITSYRLDDRDFRLLGAVPVTVGKKAYLYDFLPFPGRYLFYSNATSAADDRKAMEMISEKRVDMERELIISGPAPAERVSGVVRGDVRGALPTANRLILDTETDRDSFLYVSDTHYPGWRAYIDGKRTPLLRANLAFRAVFLPGGIHRVEFRYVPLSFYAGLAITVLGVLGCAFLVRRESKKDSKQKGSPMIPGLPSDGGTCGIIMAGAGTRPEIPAL